MTAIWQPTANRPLPASRFQSTIAAADRGLVSAIVSTYNSEHFIRGCMEDLVGQTIAHRLEIVIVDSGSEQQERAVVDSYRERFPRIVYVRTERESLYASWNRAIGLAHGEFFTICNTDDRHRKDALEVLASTLSEDRSVDLVYGDCHLSHIPNETHAQAVERHVGSTYRFPDFFAPAVLLHFQIGPQFMWRRSAHEHVGPFDERFRAAGDYDFNMRFYARFKARHIPEPLGLYLVRGDSISGSSGTSRLETQQLWSTYRTPELLERLYRAAGVPCRTPFERAVVHLDMGMRSLRFFPPWGDPRGVCDLGFAMSCFQAARELAPEWIAAEHNALVARHLAGECSSIEVTRELRRLLDRVNGESAVLEGNLAALAAGGPLYLIRSPLALPSQSELARWTKGSVDAASHGNPLGTPRAAAPPL